MRVSSARLNAVAILVGVAAFVALEAAAMRLYPGGTWWDSQARGHRFWENYLCDLEWRVALDGAPNAAGARVAFCAMATLAAALGPFWFAAASALSRGGRRATGRAVRVCGVASAIATIAVVCMPSEQFGSVHGVAVIAASLLGLAAAAMAIHGLRAVGRGVAASLGAATLAVAAFDLALYVSHLVTHTEGSTLAPAAQKVALGLLLAWMLAVAGLAGEAARDDATPAGDRH